MTKKALSVQKATEVVRQIMAMDAAPGEDAYIYLWPKPSKHAGVRVVECGYYTDHSGAAWMQSEPAGLAVCAAVERVILELLTGDDRGEEDSEVDRQIHLLNYIIQHGAGE